MLSPVHLGEDSDKILRDGKAEGYRCRSEAPSWVSGWGSCIPGPRGQHSPQPAGLCFMGLDTEEDAGSCHKFSSGIWGYLLDPFACPVESRQPAAPTAPRSSETCLESL